VGLSERTSQVISGPQGRLHAITVRANPAAVRGRAQHRYTLRLDNVACRSAAWGFTRSSQPAPYRDGCAGHDQAREHLRRALVGVDRQDHTNGQKA
jgi:hypothetical protein